MLKRKYIALILAALAVLAACAEPGGTAESGGTGQVLEVTFDINADNNGDGAELSSSSLSVAERSSVTLPYPKKDPDGYVIKGFSEDPAGEGILYPADTSYTPTSDVLLYAVWQKNPITKNVNRVITREETEKASGDIVVPYFIGGKKVTAIGKSAFASRPVTSVVIPPTITRIEDNAFNFCTHLTLVITPSSVTYIGDKAFGHCATSEGLKDKFLIVVYQGTEEAWNKIEKGASPFFGAEISTVFTPNI